MQTIYIDQATPRQLDYAAAIAQGWYVSRTSFYKVPVFVVDKDNWFAQDTYHPTTDQAQCGILIDVFKIATSPQNNEWCASIKGIVNFDKSRLIAAVTAYLLSVYHDGMIPVAGD